MVTLVFVVAPVAVIVAVIVVVVVIIVGVVGVFALVAYEMRSIVMRKRNRKQNLRMRRRGREVLTSTQISGHRTKEIVQISTLELID
jgi:hypothetical protein